MRIRLLCRQRMPIAGASRGAARRGGAPGRLPLGSVRSLPKHPDEHRPERPVFLAVDQETPSSWLVQFGHRVVPIAMSV
jgi:hypothetical protein